MTPHRTTPGRGGSARRGVLFDLDGTLLDTIDDIVEALNESLTLLGCPTHPAAACRMFVGEGVERLLARALPGERQDRETILRGVRLFDEAYARSWNRHTRVYDGIPELLDGLSSRRIPMAVLSNKPHRFTRMAVGHFLGRWEFDPVQGAADDVPRKPDPTGALSVARRMGLPSGEMVYLGDSSVDMRTAIGAGMLPVGAAWGFRGRSELSAAGAALVIDAPPELLTILGTD
jgi:phosphoglycolate phosphatase